MKTTKICPKCKSKKDFKPSLTIRNRIFTGNEGTISPYAGPVLDETALKCPDCGYTIQGGKINETLWNP